MEAQDSGLLAAVLRAGAGENAADFADERTLHPELAGLIEETAHLGVHISEPCWRPEDNGIRIGELVNRGDGDVLEGFLGLECSCLFKDIGSTVSGTRRKATSAPVISRAPSAAASAILYMWPYVEWKRTSIFTVATSSKWYGFC